MQPTLSHCRFSVLSLRENFFTRFQGVGAFCQRIICFLLLVSIPSFLVQCEKPKSKAETAPARNASNQAGNSQNPYAELVATHPAKNPKLYDLSKPWHERVFNLDEIHKDYVLQMNKIDNFSEIPKQTSKLELMKKRILSIAQNEPSILKEIRNRYIFAIYFSENLGGTGITGVVYLEDKPIGGYILFDAGLLNQKGNEWITYKERSAFKNAEKEINVQIEEPSKDSEVVALEYLLLHELGHVVSLSEDMLPDQRKIIRDYLNYDFTGKDWKEENTSNWDDLFPQRKNIRFYSGSSYTTNDAIAIYENLKKTPFPTLYSAINANDHFAESFVSYIHIYIYKKPWILTISENGQIIYTMSNGITEPRSLREKKYIEKILKLNE